MGSTVFARTFYRFGLRRLMLVGALLLPARVSSFALLAASAPAVIARIGSFLLGLGMGLMSLCSLIIIQESVDVGERGSATASNVFSRNLGSALGATVFGAIFNFALLRFNGGVLMPEMQLRQLLQGSSVDLSAHTPTWLALGGALHATFVALFLVSLLTAAVAWLLPRGALMRSAVDTRAEPVTTQG